MTAPARSTGGGDDLVIVDDLGNFVTVMRGGAANARYRRSIASFRDKGMGDGE